MHAKSTAVTHSYVLANICFRTATFIMLVSDTEGQASNFLNSLKAEFTDNKELMEVFDVKGLSKDTATEFIVDFKDGHQACILAKGSGQKVRGTTWLNKRPNLIIGDDLENDDIVMNEERRKKFDEWFTNALIPCRSKKGKVRVVGTILHLDSQLENLMPNPVDEQTHTDGLKQYSTDLDRVWHSYRFKAHNEDYSEILWPEQFDEKRLKFIRRDYLDRGNPAGYSQEYLNYPIDESTAYFKKRDFLKMTEPNGQEEFYVACDLAISEKKSRAFTVFVVASTDSTGKLRFRDVVRFRGDSLEIIDELFRLQNIYKPECFFIEQENIARSLGPVIDKEMQERGVYLTIEKMMATQDKIKRARALQARMRAGMVEVDHDADWFPEFQQELLQFPRGKYMDQVDSAAWIALGLEKIVPAQTREEYEDEQYELEMEETFDPYGFGRSSITGY